MIKIRVPATTANLGPGFDSLGLALKLYNEYSFKEVEEGLQIKGFQEEYVNEDNLVYKSMMKTFDLTGYKPKGIFMDARVDIPISRGLGSSAACILGGVMGANEMAGSPLSRDEIFQVAVDIEGHPDNISPALYGGLTASIMEEGKPLYNRIEIKEGIKFLTLVPDFTLSTQEARAVLPEAVSYKDAVSNLSRVSLLISALANGNFHLLKYAFKDRLHQPYRGKLIENFDEILNQAEKLGAFGAFLSGAGPTIMCIIEEGNKNLAKNMEVFLSGLKSKWEVKELLMDYHGAQVL